MRGGVVPRILLVRSSWRAIAMTGLLKTACLCGLLLVLFLPGCSDDPSGPGTGTIRVLVTDGTGGPAVPDAEIGLAPLGLSVSTNSEGRAIFRVPPGEYFVDASLCCVGPGFIQYHEPVTVIAGRTENVTLIACLSCD
jgi:hypothetical protein